MREIPRGGRPTDNRKLGFVPLSIHSILTFKRLSRNVYSTSFTLQMGKLERGEMRRLQA